MNEDPHCGCGISKIWATGPDDPFMAACLWHDQAYTQGSKFQAAMSRLEVDRHFLRAMFAVSDTWALRLRARVFYLLARLVGGQYWEGEKE